MAIGDIIVGIDIGTSKVSTVLGEVNSFGQIEILATSLQSCSGIKKGKIIDEDEVSMCVAKSIKEIEQATNFKINSAYVTIPGKYVTIFENSIVKEIKDRFAGISVKDVQAAIMQVKDVEVPGGNTLIDIIPESFVLENGQVVKDPVGNLSSSFTINAQLILANKDYIKKITYILKKAELDVDGIVPNTLAQRNLILDNNELNDNVMILDIGAGNADFGIFEGERLIYTNTIPLGGSTITNDIALVLNISEEEAEKLKKQYGLALKSFIDNDNDIALNTYKGDSTNSNNKVIKSSELIAIIEARIEEIFSIINKEITNLGIKQKINTVILSGQGMTNINKSDIAGKINLNIPIKIATNRLTNSVKPAYRTSYALIRYISAKPFIKTVASSIDVKTEEKWFKNLMEKVKEFFYS